MFVLRKISSVLKAIKRMHIQLLYSFLQFTSFVTMGLLVSCGRELLLIEIISSYSKIQMLKLDVHVP